MLIEGDQIKVGGEIYQFLIVFADYRTQRHL